MATLIASSKVTAIIGTGVSGMSVARFLTRLGQPFILFDTRQVPPNLEQVQQLYPHVPCQFGDWDEELLLQVDEIIVSPGVSLSTPGLQCATEAGVNISGDVDLFTRYAKAPVVAITGSNAKSTVTTWVGQMALAAGVKVAVGGNLGEPVLDLLDDKVQLYVLELSSFQLETVKKLNARVASILNISADHLDRYSGMPAYHAAKQRIYFGAEHIVANKKDPLTQPPLARDVGLTTFGGAADFRHMGTVMHEGALWLADGLTPLVPVSELKVVGQHNVDNALAALAIGKAVGLPMIAMLEALRQFPGLEHRCQWVASIDGVDFYNDSKGTNVGATLAAIEGLARAPAKLVVILGGDGKGADFTGLRPAVRASVRAAILIGRDAPVIASALGDATVLYSADDMSDAVARALNVAEPNDAVLLSPACASFDMFTGYEDRGRAFCQAVKEAAHG